MCCYRFHILAENTEEISLIDIACSTAYTASLEVIQLCASRRDYCPLWESTVKSAGTERVNSL